MNATLMQQLDEYVDMRNAKDSLNNELKELNGKIAVSEEHIIDMMDSVDLKSLTSTTGIGVSTVEKSFPRITDKELVYQWMHKRGFEDLFSINANTFKAFYNERLKSGEVLPDEGVELFMKTSLQLRGRKSEARF